MTLKIKFSSVYRATLGIESGNDGWIGVEPHGKAYHVIVPVDSQIARGVMACNRPTDGTPFGGYSNWIYFRCRPYHGEANNQTLRIEQARNNLTDLLVKLSQYGINAIADEDDPFASHPSINTCKLYKSKKIFCNKCYRAWNHSHEVLNSCGFRLVKYRANVDDFGQGIFVFEHECGGQVELDACTLVKTRVAVNSLIGLQACPGLCYYENVLSPCDALCAGSSYRRLAHKIAQKNTAYFHSLND